MFFFHISFYNNVYNVLFRTQEEPEFKQPSQPKTVDTWRRRSPRRQGDDERPEPRRRASPERHPRYEEAPPPRENAWEKHPLPKGPPAAVSSDENVCNGTPPTYYHFLFLNDLVICIVFNM